MKKLVALFLLFLLLMSTLPLQVTAITIDAYSMVDIHIEGRVTDVQGVIHNGEIMIPLIDFLNLLKPDFYRHVLYDEDAGKYTILVPNSFVVHTEWVIRVGEKLVTTRQFQRLGDWNFEMEQPAMYIDKVLYIPFRIFQELKRPAILASGERTFFDLRLFAHRLEETTDGRTRINITRILPNITNDEHMRGINDFLRVLELRAEAIANLTEEEIEIRNRIFSLEESFPHDSHWSWDSRHINYSGNTMLACHGFAWMLSDAAFGSSPSRTHTDLDNLQIGDIVRTSGHAFLGPERRSEAMHDMVVLLIDNEGTIHFADGNWNSRVRWNMTINKLDLATNGRYPLEVIITRHS